MIEEVVFARGVWWPRHRPDLDCWCRPHERDGLWFHRNMWPAQRERAFMSGQIEAPL